MPPSPADRSGTIATQDVPSLEQPFIGRWNQLISTTNWEKGRIIFQWREALITSGAPAADYSDEAWSLRVGGVTSQHVGRLRRVFQRFGETYERYPGLYWSHFQAAIDWEDGEMWLEGAVHNAWSVSAMRQTRWETLGAVAGDPPREEDVPAVDLDEDHDPLVEDRQADDERAHFDDNAPAPAGPDFGDEEEVPSRREEMLTEPDHETSGVKVQPFANLQELPPDLAEAFDSFKLAILRHKADGWQQISLEDTLLSLDALKELARA